MKQIIILSVAALVFLSVLGAYLFFAFGIGGFLREAATAKESATVADTRATSARNARDLLIKTNAERAILGSFVLNATDVAGAIETIEAAARTNELKASVSDITEESREWQHHALITITISARGSIRNLAKFTATVESLPFASRLANVTFQPALEGVWSGIYTLTVVESTAP